MCEALSPATAKVDRTDKLDLYAEYRVSHAWLVDPIQRTLEVLRLEGGHWTILRTCKDDARVRAEPVDAFELELGVLRADVVLGSDV